MPDFSEALHETAGGILIAIEVTANAKTAVFPDGYNAWRKAIGCRVAEEAVGGKANRAIIRLVAETLKVPQSAVTIQSGSLSSQKRLFVAGLTQTAIVERLSALS